MLQSLFFTRIWQPLGFTMVEGIWDFQSEVNALQLLLRTLSSVIEVCSIPIHTPLSIILKVCWPHPLKLPPFLTCKFETYTGHPVYMFMYITLDFHLMATDLSYLVTMYWILFTHPAYLVLLFHPIPFKLPVLTLSQKSNMIVYTFVHSQRERVFK